MKNDIIKFSDFILNSDFIKESKEEKEKLENPLEKETKDIEEVEVENIEEETEEETEEEKETEEEEEETEEEENNFSNKVDFGINKVEDNVGEKELNYNSKEDKENKENNIEQDNSDYYKLYKDKNENFSCDISIEGSDSLDAQVRLLIESDEWNLIFNGEINNGKCNIPMKKLSIFNEGTKGIIKLEVITEGNIFIPWESEFIIKVSKKVMVSFNNDVKKDTKKEKSKVQVKVNKN